MPGISERDFRLAFRNSDNEQDESGSDKAEISDEKKAEYHRMDYWSEELPDEGTSESETGSYYDPEGFLTDESDFIDDSEDLEDLVDSDASYDPSGSNPISDYTPEERDELSDGSDLHSPAYIRGHRLFLLQEKHPECRNEDRA